MTPQDLHTNTDPAVRTPFGVYLVCVPSTLVSDRLYRSSYLPYQTLVSDRLYRSSYLPYQKTTCIAIRAALYTYLVRASRAPDDDGNWSRCNSTLNRSGPGPTILRPRLCASPCAVVRGS